VLVAESIVMSNESIDLLELWQQLRRELEQAQADYDQQFLVMQKKQRAKSDVAFIDRAVFDEDRRRLRIAQEVLKDSTARLAKFEKEHDKIAK
jgi:hypothetical protein